LQVGQPGKVPVRAEDVWARGGRRRMAPEQSAATPGLRAGIPRQPIPACAARPAAEVAGPPFHDSCGRYRCQVPSSSESGYAGCVRGRSGRAGCLPRAPRSFSTHSRARGRGRGWRSGSRWSRMTSPAMRSSSRRAASPTVSPSHPATRGAKPPRRGVRLEPVASRSGTEGILGSPAVRRSAGQADPGLRQPGLRQGPPGRGVVPPKEQGGAPRSREPRRSPSMRTTQGTGLAPRAMGDALRRLGARAGQPRRRCRWIDGSKDDRRRRALARRDGPDADRSLRPLATCAAPGPRSRRRAWRLAGLLEGPQHPVRPRRNVAAGCALPPRCPGSPRRSEPGAHHPCQCGCPLLGATGRRAGSTTVRPRSAVATRRGSPAAALGRRGAGARRAGVGLADRTSCHRRSTPGQGR
jgi:hypothetical protein